MPKKLTQEEFIKRALDLYGNRFDYSKVKYVNCITKVCIICPQHGEFNIRPSDFLRGVSCPSCSGVKKMDTEDFIKKARLIWGDKYDYSKVEYNNNKTKVCIICPEHGEFWQRPNDHLSGYGCIKCGGNYQYTTEEWIEKAKKVHENKYLYDKVRYLGADRKVCIICPQHGEFWQRPANHVCLSAGCPSCNSNLKSRMEEEIYEKLTDYGLEVERQKTFKWLKYKSYLYLDFYLPKYNIAIEVQGEQHFVPIEKFGGNSEFKIQNERDKKKKELCENNGVKLFYITKRNNNINEIIKYINETTI